MKKSQNNGRLVAEQPQATPTVEADALDAYLNSVPNYAQQRVELWTQHKRQKMMAHMALRHGDLMAAMGFMRSVHEARLAIEKTRLDEFVARSESSIMKMLEGLKPKA